MAGCFQHFISKCLGWIYFNSTIGLIPCTIGCCQYICSSSHFLWSINIFSDLWFLQATKKIRETILLNECTPIVAVTANAMKGDVEKVWLCCGHFCYTFWYFRGLHGTGIVSGSNSMFCVFCGVLTVFSVVPGGWYEWLHLEACGQHYLAQMRREVDKPITCRFGFSDCGRS